MTIYPLADDDCYQPPPDHECEEFQHHIDLAPGHRMGFRQVYRRGTSQMVYFAIWQAVRQDEEWHPVARIDCSHGTVHRHQFTQLGENHRIVLVEIPVERGREVVDRWYEPAEAMMQNDWVDNIRRWHGDQE
ncbi:hypothetical protein RB614_02125 [Phytohabitans sp. ZYX-F-186]|uniref:DUF7718 domain-containing protein n=1 Tax=Phytohabitans maris TaxID=3071409 RepID=A0ABU0ZAF9_9ACTN|nr:hypothetical protein [Phytohabitans sp. ZYX-F-186]MDQ7903317.1 hypothetical protein [Phytohabitans sp. ZYX-F-186]